MILLRDDLWRHARALGARRPSEEPAGACVGIDRRTGG